MSSLTLLHSPALLVVTAALCCGLATQGASPPPPDSAESAASAESLTWSTLNLRSTVIEDHWEAYGDVFAPVWLNESSTVFFQPYSSNATDSDTDAGIGLGFRHLISQDWAVGANVFYDHSWMQGNEDVDVNQFGAGIELIGTWLDIRVNYYRPDTAAQVASSQRIGRVAAPLGVPYGKAHGVVQDYQWMGVNQERLAAAGEGWDAEVGVLVPWLDQWLETRAYFGGYSYNSTSGPDVRGLKARMETRLTDWLYADAGWIENKEVAGGNWFAGLRVSIPLGKHPAPSEESHKTALESDLGYRSVARSARERMNESVGRNSRAVITSSTTRTTYHPEGSPKTLLLRDDIVFVDLGEGKAGNPGTFEKPARTIQGGVDQSARLYGDQGTVFVQGRRATYPESVLLQHGVQLFGSGAGMPVDSPLTGRYAFQGRTSIAPQVTGGFIARNLTAPIGISGFNITPAISSSLISATGRPAAGTGIFLENVSTATLQHNQFHGSSAASAGIYVETNGAHRSDVRIENNALTGNPGQPAVGFQAIVLSSNNTSQLTAFLEGNTVAHNGGEGVVAATFDTSTLNVGLSGNAILFNDKSQIVALSIGGALNFSSTGTLSNTVAEAPGASSLYDVFSGSPTGFIFINDALQPAGTTLP